MFTNIGGKIKGLAKFFCWAGIIASVILGFVMIISGAGSSNKNSGRNNYNYKYDYSYTVKEANAAAQTSGIVLLIVGPLVSWMSSLALYGFGELIERTVSIDEKLGGKKPDEDGQLPEYIPDNAAAAPAAGADEQARKLQQLQLKQALNDGLITQEEYDEKTNRQTSDDEDWTGDEDGYVKCPRCNNRMTIDFIRARKECPSCGKKYFSVKA